MSAGPRKISLTLASGKTVDLANFQVVGANQLKLSITFKELNVTTERTIDIGELRTWLKNNVGKTWKDWATPILLNDYDSYAWAVQTKQQLDSEAT